MAVSCSRVCAHSPTLLVANPHASSSSFPELRVRARLDKPSTGLPLPHLYHANVDLLCLMWRCGQPRQKPSREPACYPLAASEASWRSTGLLQVKLGHPQKRFRSYYCSARQRERAQVFFEYRTSRLWRFCLQALV